MAPGIYARFRACKLHSALDHVNLILLEPAEIGRPLPRSDRRVLHLLSVLHRTVGDTCDAGLVNGPRGKATLVAVDEASITLAFTPGAIPPPPAPITLVIGLPRPQTARDVLRDATTLGVAALHFVLTEKSERSYADSSLWQSHEWRRHALLGAEQAFDTRIPDVAAGSALAATLATLSSPVRLALDNYESPGALGSCRLERDAAVALAIGPERGWSAADRDALRRHHFQFVHLGERVLRTEAAVIAAVTLVRAGLGLM
jgi:RsmE family RNA methyltransferase